jgi:hypothetical protein
MSTRPRILAAQGAAVALLVLVVYITLLRPDSTEPLRGISTPGSDQRTEAPSERPGSRLDRGRDRRGDGRPRGGTRTPAEADRVGATPGITASAGESPAAGPFTAADDQYADAVAALLAKVAGAAPTDAD